MKKLVVLVVLTLLVCQIAFCAEPGKQADSTFQILERCDVAITIPRMWFEDSYCLTSEVVLACGDSDSTSYPDCYLYTIETDSMEVIYASHIREWDNYWLYKCETKNHVIVLQESPTEFCSILRCSVLDVRKREFWVVGYFRVALPLPEGVDGGNDYPVDQIRITSTDTLATFRFPGQPKLWLNGDDTNLEVDSAVYQLDFRAGGLKLIYPRK